MRKSDAKKHTQTPLKKSNEMKMHLIEINGNAIKTSVDVSLFHMRFRWLPPAMTAHKIRRDGFIVNKLSGWKGRRARKRGPWIEKSNQIELKRTVKVGRVRLNA